MSYRLLRPFLFQLPAETTHRMTIAALRMLPQRSRPELAPTLTQRVAGIPFPNPVGWLPVSTRTAKSRRDARAMGFGFVGNRYGDAPPARGQSASLPVPLTEDRAVINRMGLTTTAPEAVAQRLLQRPASPGIVGVNIGANKDLPDRIADYAQMTRMMAPLANYLTVNISSPNTPGLRALQDEGALAALLDAVMAARGVSQTPIFLKLAPDLETSDIDAICRIALDKRLDALIVSNTTIRAHRCDRVMRGKAAACRVNRCAIWRCNACAISARPAAGRSR
jgi:dihydroorotate dehydrogenase